ncbi:MAG: hypothetical protein RBR73_01860 [Halothiobacillaceae bacterium]|jgi:hypothetical protein|nr:hypothetical protein [Halothiobacillaceae bacterium]
MRRHALRPLAVVLASGLLAACNETSSTSPGAEGEPLRLLMHGDVAGPLLDYAVFAWGEPERFSAPRIGESTVLVIDGDFETYDSLRDSAHPLHQVLSSGSPVILIDAQDEEFRALAQHGIGVHPADYSPGVLLLPEGGARMIAAPTPGKARIYSDTGTMDDGVVVESSAPSLLRTERWSVGSEAARRLLAQAGAVRASGRSADARATDADPLSCTPAGSPACVQAQGDSRHSLKPIRFDFDFEGTGHCLSTAVAVKGKLPGRIDPTLTYTGMLEAGFRSETGFRQCPVVELDMAVSLYRNWPLNGAPNRVAQIDLSHTLYPKSLPQGDFGVKVSRLDHGGAYWYQVAMDSSLGVSRLSDAQGKTVVPGAGQVRLLAWQPQTVNQNTNISKTFGWSLDVSGDLQGKTPGGSVSGGVSFSRSVSYDLPDWAVADKSQIDYQATRFEQMNPYPAYKNGTALEDYKWWCVGQGVIKWAGVACHALAEHIKSENLGGGERGEHLSTSTINFLSSSALSFDSQLNAQTRAILHGRFQNRWDAVGCNFVLQVDPMTRKPKQTDLADCRQRTDLGDSGTWRHAIELPWTYDFVLEIGALPVEGV